MDLAVTLAVLVAAGAAAGIANYLERRPQPLGRPPLVPYTAIQMVAVLVVLLALAHLVSVLTGTQLKGRLSR